MLLTNQLKVSIKGTNKKRYLNLGYEILEDNGEQYFFIDIKDLPKASNERVQYRCDICGDIHSTPYSAYNKHHGSDDKDSCIHCKGEKTKRTCIEKYGVDSPMKVKGIRDNIKKTFIEKYGVDNPSKCEEIKRKKEETTFKNYGVIHPLQSDEIRRRICETNLKKYGVKYPAQCQEVQEKMKRTYMERYGVDNPTKNQEISRKALQSIYKTNAANSSSQQIYINELYCGELNYLISHYFIDIYKEKDKVCIEYDGGAHDLQVTLGRITKEEFMKKEMIREKTIRSLGNRIIRIICPRDRLPSDDVLLKMYDDALKYFNSTNHSWRNYYVEEGMFRDAEHTEKTFYDYGKLWNAKPLSRKSG